MEQVNGDPQRSIHEVQDEIIDEMGALDDGLERYRYLVTLGRALPPADKEIRTDANALGGCQTTVWIEAELREGMLRLLADSDAMITRGILSLLLRVLDGRPAAEVADAELYFLDRTGLRDHLSPARANGLAGMVERIRSYAREHRADGRPPEGGRGPGATRAQP